MGNFGFLEMGTIVVLALLVFGPDRLPEVARNVAKFVARFREETGRSIDELKRAAQVEGLDAEIRGIRDEFGLITKDVKGMASDLGRTMQGSSPSSSRRAIQPPPPFDPDAT